MPVSTGRKLLVLSCQYYPDACGVAPMATDFCQGLAALGWDVTVRCSYPFYPEWTDKSGQNDFRIRKTEEKGVHVERHYLFIPSKPRSLWQRALHEASPLFSIGRSIFRGRFDAVVAFCPLMGAVALGTVHRLTQRVPLMVCIQDIPADAAAASGISSSAWIYNLFARIQRTVLNRCDVWRSINQTMIDRISELRDRNQPLLLIPDWLHTDLELSIKALPSKVGRGASDPPKLFYSGNIGAKQGLLDFCKVIGATSTPFKFRINGAGSGAASIREWVQSTGDSRFEVGGLTDEAGFIQALHDADLFVITEKADGRASFFPSKSIPGMTVNTPILAVAGDDSPLSQEVRKFNLGPWLPWERISEFESLLKSLDTEKMTTWQNATLARSRFYNRDNCLQQFNEALEAMLPKPIEAPVSEVVVKA